ncbi:pyridoxamine 5'-phosphate oxidase family protein [Streptomyces marispadix]|uniref:pyridoxamine 5'-phosphate oxidase family protein n=1 Tax=Streptomyces marispadix TaxID=2922868 RepID=UPI0027E29EC2|nr:pyridoxamine 5'-phosphate oxidase family protein [Streptomyces marispadix]
MAEAEEPRAWVGQGSRTEHEHGREPEHDRAAPEGARRRAGSEGERRLQRRLGTSERAERFYDEQVLDHLNDRMREFVQRQEMFFLATADASGECDSSFRAGPAGFLRVLGERSLAYPEYRGNGVHASLGNIEENPHLGIMLIDFTRARIGLHINGRAAVLEDEEFRALYPDLPADPVPGRRPQVWVHVEVEEAYIHCAKHIPQLQKAPKRTARDWGTDDYKRKGGDFFGTGRDARERAAAGEAGGAREHTGLSEPEPAGHAGPVESVGPNEPVATAPSEATPSEATASESALEAAESTAAGVRGPEEARSPGSLESSLFTPSSSSSSDSPSYTSSSSYSYSSSSASAPAPSSVSGASASTTYDELRGYVSEKAHSETSGAGGLTGTPTVPEQRVPEQRRSPDWQWPEAPPPPLFPSSSRDSQERKRRTERAADTGQGERPGQNGPAGPTAMDGASGALAARAAQSAGGFHMNGSDPDAWRQEAERALAEAQRRGAMSETGTFQGWFG